MKKPITTRTATRIILTTRNGQTMGGGFIPDGPLGDEILAAAFDEHRRDVKASMAQASRRQGKLKKKSELQVAFEKYVQGRTRKITGGEALKWLDKYALDHELPPVSRETAKLWLKKMGNQPG